MKTQKFLLLYWYILNETY